MQTQQRKARLRRRSIRKLMGIESGESASLMEAALLLAALTWWRE